jgi:hypothetical protein
MFSEMFKSIQGGFSKFVTPQRLFVLIVFSVLAWFLLSYSGSKSFNLDSMETGTDSASAPTGPAATVGGSAVGGSAVGGSAVGGSAVANPNELLPVDTNSAWAALNPVNMNQGSILNGDMLQAGYHIGLDTIGQTLKNANLQLRSDPIIPKQEVGPWNQSTYEPDYGRIPLEIGCGPQ